MRSRSSTLSASEHMDSTHAAIRDPPNTGRDPGPLRRHLARVLGHPPDPWRPGRDHALWLQPHPGADPAFAGAVGAHATLPDSVSDLPGPPGPGQPEPVLY